MASRRPHARPRGLATGALRAKDERIGQERSECRPSNVARRLTLVPYSPSRDRCYPSDDGKTARCPVPRALWRLFHVLLERQCLSMQKWIDETVGMAIASDDLARGPRQHEADRELLSLMMRSVETVVPEPVAEVSAMVNPAATLSLFEDNDLHPPIARTVFLTCVRVPRSRLAVAFCLQEGRANPVLL